MERWKNEERVNLACREEGDLTMSIHSIQHDYLDFRLKKAEEAEREQFCVEMMKRLFKGTCKKRVHDLLL